MADVFISYASQDRAKIAPLVEELEKSGYSVWWDQDLEGGSRFSERIEQELISATVVLVAWSAKAVSSRWVADEADLALETGNILPISLDGSRPPLGFRQLQTIDFTEWKEGLAPCFGELLQVLGDEALTRSRTPNQPLALPQSQNVKSDASIAVLPFVDMSLDKDQEYFTDGISEELLNLLAKIKEMAVIARTSSFSFKGTNKPISEIGALLGVAYVLEGSIRKSGNRVRITAQLIETKNSLHIWSQTYDRTFDDIFVIQDEISAAIVTELKGLILGGENIHAPQAQRTSDINSYEHYLLGQQLLIQRTRDSITRGKEHFEQALESDPDYIPALAGLADAVLLLSDVPGCYGTTPLKQALAEAEPLLGHALRLDDASVEAHGVMSMYAELSGDLEKALAHAKRAVMISPSYARGYHLLSIAYYSLGDPAAPLLSTKRKASELEPTSLFTLSGLVNDYRARLNFQQAETLVAQMAAIDPGSPLLTNSRALLKSAQGDYKGALELLLEPDVAFANGSIAWHTLHCSSRLGNVKQVEPFDPILAMDGYMVSHQGKEAHRFGSILMAREGTTESYPLALNLAEWKTREGQYEDALSLLSLFDEPDPDKWGLHFGEHFKCSGAMLSLHCRVKLGKQTSARHYLEKLKDIHRTLVQDPDGEIYFADEIAAAVAAAEGDSGTALSALERQVSRTMCDAICLLSKPNFDDLRDEPRFQALLAKVEAYYANQRAAAAAEGLLPIPEELLARLKDS